MTDAARRRSLPALVSALAPLLCAAIAAAAPAADGPAAEGVAPADAAAAIDRRPTVAVLYFDYDGPSEDLVVLRKGLAQMLVSDLSAVERARLVERSRLEEVLAELELTAAKKVDPATAARIGALLGARYLVLGGFFDLGGALRVDARVVDVETSRIVKAVGVTGTPGDFLGVEQELAGKLRKVVEAALPPLPARADTPPEAAPSPQAAPSGAEKEPKPPKKRRKRPKPPKKLDRATAVRYSRALDARDRGDEAAARRELEGVLAVQPDFELATMDLAGLMQ